MKIKLTDQNDFVWKATTKTNYNIKTYDDGSKYIEGSYRHKELGLCSFWSSIILDNRVVFGLEIQKQGKHYYRNFQCNATPTKRICEREARRFLAEINK